MHRDGRPSGGRPKGRLNDKTLRVQAFCRSVIEDEEYQASILERARTNSLGSMEAVLWAYGYGKPKESIDLRVGVGADVREDLAELTLEELHERARALSAQIDDACQLEKVLSGYTPPYLIAEKSSC